MHYLWFNTVVGPTNVPSIETLGTLVEPSLLSNNYCWAPVCDFLSDAPLADLEFFSYWQYRVWPLYCWTFAEKVTLAATAIPKTGSLVLFFPVQSGKSLLPDPGVNVSVFVCFRGSIFARPLAVSLFSCLVSSLFKIDDEVITEEVRYQAYVLNYHI